MHVVPDMQHIPELPSFEQVLKLAGQLPSRLKKSKSRANSGYTVVAAVAGWVNGASSSSAPHDDDMSSVAIDRRDCFIVATGLAPVS